MLNVFSKRKMPLPTIGPVKLPRASNSIPPWLLCRVKTNTLSTVYQKQPIVCPKEQYPCTCHAAT